MSKPEKKKDKKEPPSKHKAVRRRQPSGLLVALEGAHAPSLQAEAERLARMCSGGADPAWSLWDASNTFHELGMAKSKNLTPTPRTLMLLYASDLLFRLRWEIEPALAEGRTVVAAPYVESAMAIGAAAGLPKEWLEELFSFAPKPVACFRLKEKKVKKKVRKADMKAGDSPAPGFVEFLCASLKKNHTGWDNAEVRGGMLKYFKDLEGQDGIRKLGKKLPKALAKAVRRETTA